MSRKPRTSMEQRVARRLGTMAPGGTIASESPVVRPKGMAGGAPPAAAPPTWIDFWYWPPADYNNGEVGVDVSYWFETGNAGPGSGWVDAGDTCVMVACMLDRELTAPTGWTTLVSGNLGDFWYWAGYTDDVTLDASVVIGTSGGVVTSECMVYLLGFTDVPAGYHLVATAPSESPAATSHDIAQPGAGWLFPWTNLLTHGGGGTTKYLFMDFMDGTWTQMEYGMSNGLPAGYSYQAFSHPGVTIPDPCVVETFDWDTMAIPFTTDAVTFAIGWSQ